MHPWYLLYAYACNRCNGRNYVGGTQSWSTRGELGSSAPRSSKWRGAWSWSSPRVPWPTASHVCERQALEHSNILCVLIPTWVLLFYVNTLLLRTLMSMHFVISYHPCHWRAGLVQWWELSHWVTRSWVRSSLSTDFAREWLVSVYPFPRPHSCGSLRHWVCPFY